MKCVELQKLKISLFCQLKLEFRLLELYFTIKKSNEFANTEGNIGNSVFMLPLLEVLVKSYLFLQKYRT